MTAEGIVHVDAGPEVCRCVRCVEHAYHSAENIIPWHNDGAQIVPVWPQGADDQKNGHSRKQESAGPKIILFVFKEKIHNHRRHIGKPQEVGDDKHLAERDQVVRRYVDQSVMSGHGSFQIGKPLQIHDSVKKQRQRVPVFMK